MPREESWHRKVKKITAILRERTARKQVQYYGLVAKWRQLFPCWHDTDFSLGLGVLHRKELGSPPAAPLVSVWLISTRNTLANPLPFPTITNIKVKDQNLKTKHAERLVFSKSEKRACLSNQMAWFSVWTCWIIEFTWLLSSGDHAAQRKQAAP